MTSSDKGLLTGAGKADLCFQHLRKHGPAAARRKPVFQLLPPAPFGAFAPQGQPDSQEADMAYALSLGLALIEEIRRLGSLGASCEVLAIEYGLSPNTIKYLTKYPTLFDALPRCVV